MHRFVAMMWDHTTPAPQHVDSWTRDLPGGVEAWRLVLDGPGIRVLLFARRGEPPAFLPMSDVEGVVIGYLFQRGEESAGPKAALGRVQSLQLVHTSGQSLVSDFWGNYLALWRDPDRATTSLLRDPCGGVPCYVTHAAGVDLYFSDVTDVAGLEGVELSIDWLSVQGFLLNNYFVTRHTGFNEVSEVLPGQRVDRAADGQKRYSWVWNAAAVARDVDHRGLAAIESAARETTGQCLSAWAHAYRSIAVQLSGGLDSSVVLHLLRRGASTPLSALHLVGVEYEAYELELARLSATHAGVMLLERQVDYSAAHLGPMLDAPLVPRPTKQVLGLHAATAVADACRDLGATAVMAGHGGDALFLQRSIATHTLVDYLELGGRACISRVAYDAATLQSRSIWSVLSHAWRDSFDRKARRASILRPDAPMRRSALLPDAASALPPAYRIHPWLEDPADLPPGKVEQLASILALYRYQSAFADADVDSVNPLFSQPIVELALRLPTYQFARGGLDRALERRAFARFLPARVAARTNKGFINHQLLEMIRRNLTQIQELVFDGELISQPWVDRDYVSELLTEDKIAQGDDIETLLNVVCAEAWVKQQTPSV